MIIHVPNKNTLIIDDFILKCCVGKTGLNSNKKEGDYSTPKGFYKEHGINLVEEQKQL